MLGGTGKHRLLMGPSLGSNDCMSFIHRDGTIDSSTSSILRVVIPLVLSAFSENLMFLIDRVFLAYYSVDAMNAAMLGGSLAGLYTLMLMAVAGTTEVFVGQYNGEGRRDKVALPVWQMIYFSLFSLVFVVPIGYFTEHLNLIPECYKSEGIPYQRLITYFCWLPALTAALAGFFIGRGKTKIITAMVFAGTFTNIVLDYVLVLGYRDIIPALGCRGAAIGTIVAEAVQIAILAVGFWSERNRDTYGTAKNIGFDASLFGKCLKIGAPMAICKCVEMLAWYLVCVALSHVSKDLATTHGMAMTVYVSLAFVCDGLSKGAATLSANFIGQKDLNAVRKTFKKLTIITLIICCSILLPLLAFPGFFFGLLNTLHEDISALYPSMTIIFRIMFVGIAAEAFGAIAWGILISGGDVKYPIIANLLSIWGITVLPVGVLFFTDRLQSAIVVQLFVAVNMVVFAAIIYRRYRGLNWYKSLTD
ncbi:MAG: MATE family efflux transporter [Puniceicoccales bacterium]|jgi:MATE family multidrug resistance protein|nr:MATE family efflux transporter [Puniceicoccales bacterium]